jgi:hypothetical protein
VHARKLECNTAETTSRSSLIIVSAHRTVLWEAVTGSTCPASTGSTPGSQARAGCRLATRVLPALNPARAPTGWGLPGAAGFQARRLHCTYAGRTSNLIYFSAVAG